VGEEADDQAVAVADPLDVVPGLVGDLGDGVASEVGQLGERLRAATRDGPVARSWRTR
jgi:hypothetical protein